MVPWWSPTKIVQMVLIGWIRRSRGQKIGFQNAIFKNLLVWNYKAQSFHIWNTASSRGPLPKLFKLCPWGQNCPRPGGHNFTNWIIWGKVQTTSSLEPLMVIWPNSTGMVPGWSPTKIVQMVLVGWISRSRGQKIGFQNAIFKNLLVMKLQGPELSYLEYSVIYRSTTNVIQIMPLGSKLTPPRRSQFYIELY